LPADKGQLFESALKLTSVSFFIVRLLLDVTIRRKPDLAIFDKKIVCNTKA